MTTDMTPPRLIESLGKGKKTSHRYAKYNCYCGNEFVARIDHVQSGNTRSCGCYATRRRKESSTQHGGTGTKTYSIWQAMNSRCKCTSHVSFKNYGGRGIKVCSRWESFETFLQDMGECPEGYSIERLDPEGDYCPENCTWIPLRKQNDNTRKTVRLTYRGETKTLKEWSAATGLSMPTLYHRVERGWPVDRILTQPQRGKGGGLCH